MSHLQYTMPGDPRLVDQLVYELKSKGIFDKFRKECMADVDTRPAYQNLRQRVEGAVAGFLQRTPWRPGLNKNQLREKLRKHILDGNYLEQGVERIVDQVVNPKVASVFIPQVEELVYSYLGLPRRRGSGQPGPARGQPEPAPALLPTGLEAVSPGSVVSNDDNKEEQAMDTSSTDAGEGKMDVDEVKTQDEVKDEVVPLEAVDKEETRLSGISDLTSHGSDSRDHGTTLPAEIKPENKLAGYTIPKIDLAKIEMPKDSDIPLPDAPMPEDMPPPEKDDKTFKPINSDDNESSSDSSDLRRNVSPLTPVRNFDDENSCDAQQAFENNASENKNEESNEPAVSNFRFSIEPKSDENYTDVKSEKKESEQTALAYQFESQVNINKFATPVYEESSNSNNLQIDYESDANSKTNAEAKHPVEPEASSQDVRKERKSSHKSSSRSRDSHRHAGGGGGDRRRSGSKQASSRDKRDDKKPSRDDHSSSKSKSSHRDRSRDRNDKKDDREPSRQRTSSSHKSSSSHKDKSHRSSSSSSHKDKSHRSSSSSRRHSSTRTDDNKSSSSSSYRDRSGKSSSKEHRSSRDSKSSSHRSDKDRKSSGASSRSKSDKDKEKKEKKQPDDHYAASGRGHGPRRSTDRDSNDGHSTSSKGSHNQVTSKAAESKQASSSSSNGTSPSDRQRPPTDGAGSQARDALLARRVVRVEHLETPVSSPRRLMPEVVLKKPKFASNLQEARRMMKMRKFLAEEQRRMNQEAALLLDFQASAGGGGGGGGGRYSRVPGPELEFACHHAPDTTPGVEDIETEANNEVKETPRAKEIAADAISFNDEEETIESIAEIQKEVDNITNFMDTDEENTMYADNNVTAYQIETKTDYFAQIEENNQEANTNLNDFIDKKMINDIIGVPDESAAPARENSELQFFGQLEKYNAELYSDQYSKFLKAFTENTTRKLFLINCDTFYENVFKVAAQEFGEYDVVSVHKNGLVKLPQATKHIDFTNKEIIIPIKTVEVKSPSIHSPLFSPVKSECSFELSSDYDAKLENMVNTTSRQQIMEIILGGAMADGAPSKMPQIAYCAESSIEPCRRTRSPPRAAPAPTPAPCRRKRSADLDNNNRQVLTSNKIRKISGSDLITSTTETEEHANGLRSTNIMTKSKYLGKARRVGLPRPRKTMQANSPSSDKSVENYESPPAPAPRRAPRPPRAPAQRYDTSDLYKPKLHFLSRRNNVT